MKVLNLGWGIQSFTLAAMVALEELEPIDAAIHADTTHERSATYTFAEKWTPWLEARGVRVITVRGNPERLLAVTTNKTSIPAYTYAENVTKTVYEYDGDGDEITGEHEEQVNIDGMLRRQCTSDWKIQPIRRWLQSNRNGDPIEQWLGISLDEAERMKPSDVKYITHRWPLIEKRMSRNDCINWIRRHDLEVPVKSSCAFCPYHNRSAWYDMKRENGADWQKAVEVDEAIRKVRPPFDLFLHADRIPLIDIRSPQDNGQLDMFSEECSGVCFV